VDNKKKTSLWKQIIRFAVVGGSAFLIDYSIMILLTEFFGINYLISNAISFTISVIYNYLLSVHWVFDVNGGRSQTQDFLVFIILSVIGLGINQLIMWLCVDKIGIFYMISKIGATGVTMVYNFITRKIFLENEKM
jgi:putative flippase GtrA